MKLMSWNVNGIRACVSHGFESILHTESPDMLCLQEVKAVHSQLNFDSSGYTCYLSPAVRLGYSGVMLLTKQEPLCVYADFPYLSDEGRFIRAEYPTFWLVNVYAPNSRRDLSRIDVKENWYNVFNAMMKSLGSKKPVIICGDMNIAHTSLDIHNPMKDQSGYTPIERRLMSELLSCGYEDTWREQNQESREYTWWSYMRDDRAKDRGWRLDYFLTHDISGYKSTIRRDIIGSDHCPIILEV